MHLEEIDHHSVAVEFLTKGPVLDAGARGFIFSNWFAERGHQVVALDPSPDIQCPTHERIDFQPYALVNARATPPKLSVNGDPGAWYVTYKEDGIAIGSTTIECLGNKWDVIKLNIEGSEYDILEEWPGPNARQIVVSFHEHTNRARGRKECDRLIEKMGLWYKPFNVVWEKRYCCSDNYWDVLFIRKDLL